MSNNPRDKKFKKWLDILQQESWQLELMISGFAVVHSGNYILKVARLDHTEDSIYMRTIY